LVDEMNIAYMGAGLVEQFFVNKKLD